MCFSWAVPFLSLSKEIRFPFINYLLFEAKWQIITIFLWKTNQVLPFWFYIFILFIPEFPLLLWCLLGKCPGEWMLPKSSTWGMFTCIWCEPYKLQLVSIKTLICWLIQNCTFWLKIQKQRYKTIGWLNCSKLYPVISTMTRCLLIFCGLWFRFHEIM